MNPNAEPFSLLSAVKWHKPASPKSPPVAEIPFEIILDRVMLFSELHTDYFIEEPPACPRCKVTITAKTLVVWDGGIEVNV